MTSTKKSGAKKVYFGRMSGGQPGDRKSMPIALGDEYVGEIEIEWRTEWSGMSRREVVGAYELTIGDEVRGVFEVAPGTNPATALAAAKKAARAALLG
jgi:hypothetical protein